VKGFIAGILGLIALQAVLNLEERGRYRPSGLLKVASEALRRALDPKVAAIPDRRAAATPAARPAGSGGQAVPRAASAYGGRVT